MSKGNSSSSSSSMNRLQEGRAAAAAVCALGWVVVTAAVTHSACIMHE